MSVNVYHKTENELEEVLYSNVNDTSVSPVSTYSSQKIENLIEGVKTNGSWTGTKAQWEAYDKSTMKDGDIVNITDDYFQENIHYSENEILTGKYWIDNKPIYRKVFAITLKSYTSDTWYNFSHGISDIGRLIESTIIGYRNSTYTQQMVSHPNCYINGDLLYHANDANGYYDYIILEYTKTTD